MSDHSTEIGSDEVFEHDNGHGSNDVSSPLDELSARAPRAADALPELEALAEQLGEFVYNWGFKRVHGRIWAHLFLASRPLDAADLVERLDISKALVSISLREMTSFKLILSAGKSEHGTLLYSINQDLFSVGLAILEQRGRQVLNRLAEAQTELAHALPGHETKVGLAPDKVSQLGELIQQANGMIDSVFALKAMNFTKARG